MAVVMADDRTYIRVHDGLDENPKVEELSDAAFRLLVSAWCYCSRNLTDGRITDAAWKKRGTPKARRDLVAAGLVEQGDGFVLMHDYLEHQRSAAQVAELRQRRREAGSKGGKARARAQANAKQVPEQTGGKTVPSTEAETDTEEEPSVEGGSHVGSDPPAEPPRCPQHKGMTRGKTPACWACKGLREQWETTRTADAVFGRPPWCGTCNEHTRLIDSEDDHTPSRRCPRCHPLAEETA